MNNVEKAIELLALRLDRIEEKLSKLQANNNSDFSTEPKNDNTGLGKIEAAQSIVDRSPKSSVQPNSRPGLPPNVSNQTKESTGLNSSSVLAFIGIAFVVLAGVFFIKLSIESGWLTPTRQVLISASFGFIFFLIPHFVPKAEQEYGTILAGAGTSILHLTWLGAYSIHHLIGGTTALLSATLIGILSIAVNFNNRNRTFLLVSLIGTYLSAPIVGINQNDLNLLVIFFIIWNVAFSFAGFINKNRDVIIIAAFCAVLGALFLTNESTDILVKQDLLVLQIIQFWIFAVSILGYSIYHKSALSSSESMSALFPLLLLYYASTNLLVEYIFPDFAPWFGVLIGFLVLGIHQVAKGRLAQLESGPILTTFSVLVIIHSFYFQVLSEGLKPAVSLIIGLIGILLWNKSTELRKNYFWSCMAAFGLFVYGAILTLSNHSDKFPTFIYNMSYGALALFASLSVLSSNNEAEKSKGRYPLILSFAHFEVMLGFYRLSEKLSFSGPMFVTLTWGLYGLFILFLAFRQKNKFIGNSALLIMLAVSLKALFYDMNNSDKILRIVCLLIEGLFLYVCGWLFKKLQAWESK